MAVDDETAEQRLVNPAEAFEREIYDQELDAREDIIESCPIDIYVASINPWWGYPNKLLPYTEPRPSVRDSCRHLIIDSGKSQIGSMPDILDAASDLDADWVIPPDHTPYTDGYEDITPEEHAEEQAASYWEWFTADIDADLLVPIHPPYREYISELKYYDPGYVDGLQDHPGFDYPDEGEEWRWNARGARPTLTLDLLESANGIAVGGLLGLTVHEQIAALETVRRAAGYDTYIHAFSPTPRPEMLLHLRDNPRLIDSMDLSTPETAPGGNKLPDVRFYPQIEYLFPPAEANISPVRGAASTMIALLLNFWLGPWVAEDRLYDMLEEHYDWVANDTDDTEQADLGAF